MGFVSQRLRFGSRVTIICAGIPLYYFRRTFQLPCTQCPPLFCYPGFRQGLPVWLQNMAGICCVLPYTILDCYAWALVIEHPSGGKPDGPVFGIRCPVTGRRDWIPASLLE